MFVALTGTAIATGGDGQRAAKSANPTKQIKKLKGKLASVERRLAALEGKPGPSIPTSLPPSGPAGGELAGSYPNPTIGTVSGLDIADSTSSTAGINFGADTSLYRNSANTLRTDDGLIISGGLDTRGANFLGDSPTDETVISGYLNLRSVTSAPVAGDCMVSQEGRMVFNTTTNELWVCDDGGWLQEIFD